jgi:hypothetical protein
MANRERSCSQKSQSVCGPFYQTQCHRQSHRSPEPTSGAQSNHAALEEAYPVLAFRLVNVNNEEVYHRTWFQEQVRREKMAGDTGRRTVEAMSA